MTQALIPDSVFERIVELRREFHRHPELSYEEVETAKRVMAELDRLGIPYEYAGKGSGVVGTLSGEATGPAVALRAEMDALPCAEKTNLPFASDVPDAMHACGHDAHMAMVLGAAALLKESPPPGRVVLVFQPAEERGQGSNVVLESGVLEGVDAIFAGHVTHHFEVGEIMVTDGVVTAQSDLFIFKVHGKGGHGARPHEAVDAIVIAGGLISAVQTLVARETNPVHPSVVTIGSIRAGSAPNIIAETAVLEGTIRTTRPEVRGHLHEGLRRLAAAFSDLHNASVSVEIHPGSLPVVNTSREVEIARRAAVDVVGDRGVVPQEYPSMGAEDFSNYLVAMPGCYVRFGARLPNREYIPLHSPVFDVDENVLQVGAAFLDRVARVAITTRRDEG